MKLLHVYFVPAVFLLLLTGCNSTLDVKKIRPTPVTDGALDDDLRSIVGALSNLSDRNHRVAPLNSHYANRLDELTRKHLREDGLRLNYKVYLDKNVNIFALADGTVRLHSSLMDIMNDDELLFMIGHEIGHIRHGHIAEASRHAAADSGVKNDIGSTPMTGDDIAASAEGKLLDTLVSLQFSPSEEHEADEYAIGFMKAHGYETEAAMTSFNKLVNLGKKNDIISSLIPSHPVTEKRADLLAQLISNNSSIRITKVSEAPVAPATEDRNTQDTAKPVAATKETSIKEIPVKESEEKTETISTKVKTPNYGFSSLQLKSPLKYTDKSTNKVHTSSSRMGTGWYAQVLASTDKSETIKVSEEIDKLGFSVSEQTAVVDGTKYHRILIGPFGTRREAEEGAQNVQDSKITSDKPIIRFFTVQSEMDKKDDKKEKPGPAGSRKKPISQL